MGNVPSIANSILSTPVFAETVYKTAAKSLHPDKGGNPDEFKETRERDATGPRGSETEGSGSLSVNRSNEITRRLWKQWNDDSGPSFILPSLEVEH